jgi:hypothetical protein
MPFIASSELRRIAVSRGAAIVQIAVTSPVVINTTKTQPGTSPRWSATALNALELLTRSNRREMPKLRLINASIARALNPSFITFILFSLSLLFDWLLLVVIGCYWWFSLIDLLLSRKVVSALTR